MDAFEIRMQFLQHLRRLTSAAQSINRVVSFLLKHSSGAHSQSGKAARHEALPNAQAAGYEDDLWECIVEELEKSSINARINVFYMLDSLLDQSIAIGIESYRDLVRRDLEKIVGLTVPTGIREGVLNRMSSMQVLNSWKMRRLLPVSQLESLLSSLQSATFPTSSSSIDNTPVSVTFSRNDILRRIEDDRERHKRLRERIWVLPVPTAAETASITKLSTVLTTTSTSTAHTSPESPASPAVQGEGKLVSLADYRKESRKQLSVTPQVDSQEANETALDIEFEQAWELLGEDGPLLKLDEADLQAMEDENARCFG